MPTQKGIQTEDGGWGVPPRNPPDLHPEDPFYYACEPNQMTYYIDGDPDKERKICVKGRNEEATRLFVEKDWEGLGRFEEWTGSPEQHYKPEDFEKMPKDRPRI